MDAKYKSALTLTFLVLIYTMYTILLKIGGATIGLIPQLFYAFLVGFVASSAFNFMIDGGKGIASIVRQPKLLLALVGAGMVNNALAQLFLGIGTVGTNPSLASVVYRSWIIVVAVLTPIVLRNKINRMQLFAILIGFIGLYIVVTGGTLLSFNFIEAPFLGFVFASALCSAFITLVMSRYTFNIYGATIVFNLVSLILMGIIAVATNTSLAISFPLSSLFTVVFLGVFGFYFATNLYYHSVKYFGPQVVGNALLAIPFVTFILSALILGTPIQPYYVVAAVLISFGIVLQKRYSSVPQRITSKSMFKNMIVYDVTGAFASNKGILMSDYIKGSGRALAIKVNSQAALELNLDGIGECVIFTSSNPHPGASASELEFVNDIIGKKNNEIVIIGMGNADAVEEALNRIHLETKQV